MRKVQSTIQEVVKKIEALKGETIRMHVNKGRKRIEKMVGIIENIYPSVFTVDVKGSLGQGKFSCSFSDILCGDVKIFKLEESENQAETIT